MSRIVSSMSAVLEKFAEFDRTAAILGMPRIERMNILNVSDETYLSLRRGRIDDNGPVTPEVERRLSYALPLMRRLAKATTQSSNASSQDGVRLQAA